MHYLGRYMLMLSKAELVKQEQEGRAGPKAPRHHEGLLNAV